MKLFFLCNVCVCVCVLMVLISQTAFIWLRSRDETLKYENNLSIQLSTV